jgi:hypothetical protein
MGVLNVTPDSFSDGGRYLELDAAVRRARELVAAGAAIVDVGGESTRPGSHPPSVDEEIRRVVPVVRAIVAELTSWYPWTRAAPRSWRRRPLRAPAWSTTFAGCATRRAGGGRTRADRRVCDAHAGRTGDDAG